MSHVCFLSGVCITSLKKIQQICQTRFTLYKTLLATFYISSHFSRCFVISSLINVSMILSYAEVTHSLLVM